MHRKRKKKCLHAIKVVQIAMKQSAAPLVQMARKRRRPSVYEHYHIHGYMNFKDNNGSDFVFCFFGRGVKNRMKDMQILCVSIKSFGQQKK